jgi:ABC-2 type transport system permease protein
VRPVERALGDLVRAQRALAAGVSAEQLAAWDRAPVVERVAAKPERGGGGGRAERIVVLVILFLLFTVLFSTISYLMVGISAEKQARVTEVVVSAIPAQSWMDGKIAAYTAIGLIMAAVWIASLLVAAVPMAFALPKTIDARLVAMTLLYAVLGLYFYNALFAAVLATMQGIQSSSRFQGYFFMLPMLPLLFPPAVIESPDAPWLAAVSMLPPFAPMLVPARMAIGGVPAWEAWLGLAILAAACGWMRGVAGRIFRVGMLMYGKDPTLPEIMRWARVK